MPKPPQTYVRNQSRTKIANQADQAKLLKQTIEAETAKRTAAFAEILKRSEIEKRLADMATAADALKRFDKEPSTKRGALLKIVGELVEHAQEGAEYLQKLKDSSAPKELHAVIGAAKKLGDAHAKLTVTVNAVNAVAVAVAFVVFVAAVKAAAKLKAKR